MIKNLSMKCWSKRIFAFSFIVIHFVYNNTVAITIARSHDMGNFHTNTFQATSTRRV